jgi:hypothetical protein
MNFKRGVAKRSGNQVVLRRSFSNPMIRTGGNGRFHILFFSFFLSFCLCEQETEFCHCSVKVVRWWASGGKSWSQASLNRYLSSRLNSHQNKKTSPIILTVKIDAD